jgi:hypothetical protein
VTSDMLSLHGTMLAEPRRKCAAFGVRTAARPSTRYAGPDGEWGRPGVTGPSALHRVLCLRPRNEHCSCPFIIQVDSPRMLGARGKQRAHAMMVGE